VSCKSYVVEGCMKGGVERRDRKMRRLQPKTGRCSSSERQERLWASFGTARLQLAGATRPGKRATGGRKRLA
jgi:hypothetical protein